MTEGMKSVAVITRSNSNSDLNIWIEKKIIKKINFHKITIILHNQKNNDKNM